jgi:hypothetical protein
MTGDFQHPCGYGPGTPRAKSLEAGFESDVFGYQTTAKCDLGFAQLLEADSFGRSENRSSQNLEKS